MIIFLAATMKWAKHTKIIKIQLSPTKHLHTFSYISHILLLCSTVIVGVFCSLLPLQLGSVAGLCRHFEFQYVFPELLILLKMELFSILENIINLSGLRVIDFVWIYSYLTRLHQVLKWTVNFICQLWFSFVNCGFHLYITL